MSKTKRTSWIKKIGPKGGVGDRMFGQLPFLFFVSCLAMFTVWNVHRAQKTLRLIESTRVELQELRWHASTLQSRIMYDNKQSEVLRRMRSQDLGLAGSSPRRLIADR